MMSNDALILDLAAGLAPVKRRSALRDGLWLLALAVIELVLLLSVGAMRPDMGRGDPFALHGLEDRQPRASRRAELHDGDAAPSRPPALPRRELRIVLGLAGLAMIGGLFLASSVDRGRSLLDRLAPVHGLLCAVSIIVLSLPMMAVLAVLMRRAAPVHPGQSALASGFAASTCGALVFTICCPMNDPLYIVVWYSAGVAVVTALTRWLLPRRFRL